MFAFSSSLNDVKSNSSLKAVHTAFHLLGHESNSFLQGSLATHSDRQGLDKVAVKVVSGDGPDQWGRGTKIQVLNFPAPSFLPETPQPWRILVLVSHSVTSMRSPRKTKSWHSCLLGFFFLLCYYFHFKPSSVTEIKFLVQRVHWKNGEAIQKLWRNVWIERKENAPQPYGYILLTALLHSYVHLPIMDIFKIWCIITTILLQ